VSRRRPSGGRSGDSGSLKKLWNRSANFRRLGWTAASVSVLCAIAFSGAPQQSVYGTNPYADSVQTAANTPPPDTAVPQNTPPPAPAVSPTAPPLQAVPVQKAEPPDNDLECYPQDRSVLGARFNPSRYAPSSGFTAYYTKTSAPNTLVYKENVRTVALNYAYNDFHNIDSQDLTAYWVGKMNVPSDGLYQFSARLSWSKVRVLLDNHVILSGTNSVKDTTVYLPKGSYTLEVEYENNWHTTSFQFTAQPVQATVQTSGLAGAIAALNPPADTVVYTVGVYESKNRDNTINIQPPRTGKPYILMLSSYEPVNWLINGQPAPFAIVYSDGRGSTVRAFGSPPLLKWEKSYSYQSGTEQQGGQCNCLPNGMFICSGGNDGGDFAQQVRQDTGFPLAGISSAYAADMLVVPQTTAVSNPQNLANQRAAQKAACERRHSGGIGQMPQ